MSEGKSYGALGDAKTTKTSPSKSTTWAPESPTPPVKRSGLLPKATWMLRRKTPGKICGWATKSTPMPKWSKWPFFNPRPRSGGGGAASIPTGLPGRKTAAPPCQRFWSLM